MLHLLRRTLVWIAIAASGLTLTSAVALGEQRFGLVIGNSEYKAGPLPTAANDAGLVAQTLQAAGFDVMGARDLDGDALRQTFRDFVEKVSQAGPDAVAFIYLAGHGVQFEGENYFAPIDARIDRDLDVPLQALRLNDYIRPLGGIGAKAVIVVLDAGHSSPFAQTGQPLAGGLALTEPWQGMLYAYNASPGTIAPPGEPPYGHYAQALAEMMREGGLPLDVVFDRVRMRVHELTSGAAVPWHASQVKAPFEFFERAPNAPPPEASLVTSSTRRARPIRDFDAQDAYLAALERDTLEGYLEFLSAFPDHPQAGRVRAIVAARREAIVWRRARNADTPEAYWTYLDRYPKGPHAWDARRRLAYLTAPPEPPPRYTAFNYDLPPPPPEEIIIIERRPAVYFSDPYWRFAPLALVPLLFLPPRPPPRFWGPPPPRPVGLFVLPSPVYVPVAPHVRPPIYVAPPRNNPLFQPGPGGGPGRRDGVPQTGPGGTPKGPGPATPVAAGGTTGPVTLPPSIGKRIQSGGTTPAVVPTGVTPSVVPGKGPGPGVGPTVPGQAPITRTQPLPGATTGTPLPPVQGKGNVVVPNQPQTSPPTKSGQPAPVILKGQPQQPNTQPAAGTPPTKGGPLPTAGTPPTKGGPLPAAGTPPAKGTPPAVITKGGPTQPPAGTLPPTKSGQPAPTVLKGVPPPVPQGKGATTPPPTVLKAERAREDRAAVEQQLQRDRQRDMERRRQEEAARQKGREQQQQMQRQQMEQQRRAMDQQRQQQQAAQAAAQARAQAAAQAAAQAKAQAAAQAAAQARVQSQQKRCGGPGLPPCPK